MRTGGDEFVVLAKHYDRAKEEKFKKNVRNEIDRETRRAGKSYQFTVSIGCCRKAPDPNGTETIQGEAELFLRTADNAMYEEKQKSGEKRD